MLLHEHLPDENTMLELEPEELAGFLMAYLNQLPDGEQNNLSRYNFFLPRSFECYPSDKRDDIRKALTESWMWLEREGLLAPQPEKERDWVFITRRGKKIDDPPLLDAMRKASILPRKILHPAIAQKIWAIFLRGDYDTAIFQAFKEVEITVRKSAGYDAEETGVPLMRKAFDAVKGPLRDKSVPKAERQALAHLFAGSMGYCRNPVGHRHVNISDSVEAVEMIIFASHLLRVVDERSSD